MRYTVFGTQTTQGLFVMEKRVDFFNLRFYQDTASLIDGLVVFSLNVILIVIALYDIWQEYKIQMQM